MTILAIQTLEQSRAEMEDNPKNQFCFRQFCEILYSYLIDDKGKLPEHMDGMLVAGCYQESKEAYPDRFEWGFCPEAIKNAVWGWHGGLSKDELEKIKILW